MVVIVRQWIQKAICGLAITLWVALALQPAHAKQHEQRVDDTGNHLTIRFDTLTVKPDDSVALVNVFYTFTTTKPHSLRGYNAHFFFDSTKMRIVDLVTTGTASQNIGYQDYNPKPPEAAVVLLGDNEIDLSKPILFAMHVRLLPGLTDTTFLKWDYIDIPDYFGVDQPIDLQNGWIRRIGGKVNVAVTTPSVSTTADSLLNLPVSISSLATANLEQARFSFTVDTSIVTLIGASIDTAAHAQLISVSSTGTFVVIDAAVAKGYTSIQGGSLLTLTLKARPRVDTACTVFTNGSFEALNSDALIDTTAISFGTICVQGSRPAVGSVEFVQPTANAIRVFPNPLRSFGSVHVNVNPNTSNEYSMTIYDLLGREVYRTTGSELDWRPSDKVTNGVYHMIVKNTQTSAMQKAEIVLER